MLLVMAAVCFLFTLAIPTAALTVGEDETSDEVVLEPTSSYAELDESNELFLDFDGFNGNTAFVTRDVFTIAVGEDADDIESVWIEHDVEGVAFYADGSEITPESRLELSSGDSQTVDVTVDTHVAKSTTETFTVVVEYEGDEVDDDRGSDSFIYGSSLSVSSTTVEAGETVTVNATYRNDGDGWGTETARLTVDGTVVDRRTVALSSGEERTVSFERRMEWPGTYEVGIEGVGYQSVTVAGPQVEVSSATIDDATITAGETADVRATVRNPSDRRIERTLELSVDGIVVDTRTVSIPANGERTVTFQRAFDEPGTYAIAVSGVDAGTVTVEERAGFDIRNRELSPMTTAALAPPATAGLLFLAIAANRRWSFVR
ncbi:hypothetical protein C488_05152 [Natrinema pellirubrum DSM 15624]|uniref:CARDB domain-containing protein n=1 Tax=Natrinema pellirubrum (strain DSM 15624 / CIP 106293 / JCM 10476 / NCIMB 786 / 157) TaxID=797303 RepID=L0JIW4_NATP1|nr:CARDB domain-containing protein [Natrinema pellirubrum]AGB30266.1 CARDB domain-containing protein [Natrinema pellirubrum DSM 15624]ELY79061.1 hypothetical protein C488_05152 [Natrinema pellirubrum DSM 15624]